MKKIISILLVISVLFTMTFVSMSTVFAEEEGGKFEELTLTYGKWHGSKDVEIPVEWTFDYFDRSLNDVDNYPVNYKMAIPAIVLSQSCCKGQAVIEDNIKRLGFSDIYSANYESEKWVNSPGYTFGYAKEKVNGVDSNIFAIAIRGTDNQSIGDIVTDIISIFNHFAPSAENIFDSFEEYVEDVTGLSKEEVCEQNNKFFITGHSLGAAVADRISELVTDYCDKTDIFSFPFATPRTRTDDYNINMPSGVTNICFIDDIVPNLLPPEFSSDPYDDHILTGKIINKYTYYDLFFGPESIDRDIFKFITGKDFDKFFDPYAIIDNHSTDYYLAFCMTMDKYPNLYSPLDLSTYQSYVFTGLKNKIEVFDGDKLIASYENGEAKSDPDNEDVIILKHNGPESAPDNGFVSVFFSKKGSYKFVVTADEDNKIDIHTDVFDGPDMIVRHFTDLSLKTGEKIVLHSGDNILANDKLYKVENEKEVAYLFGDADNDGEIRILDATAVQMSLASIEIASFDVNKSDANHNKRSDISDATEIQQYLAKLKDFI